MTAKVMGCQFYAASQTSFMHHQSRAILGYREYALIGAESLVSNIVSQSFGYSLGDKDDFPFSAAFGISQGHFDTINVIWF